MEGEITLAKIYKVDVHKCVQQGTFGTLLSGVDSNTNIKVCIKSIDCSKKIQNVRKDLELLASKLEHPNIFPLLGVYCSGNIVWTVHTNDADTSLVQRLSSGKKLELDDTLSIIHQLVSAVNFLHGCSPQLLHTDIQLNNIYLRNGKEPVALLSGCGETQVLRSLEVPSNGTESEYMAPEIVAGRKHTTMSDVFSVGAVMLVLILQDGFKYPRSDNARREGTSVNLGVEMHHRSNVGLEDVTVITMKDDDRPMAKFCKQLILEMTKSQPNTRMSLREVEPLFEQVTEKKIVSGKEVMANKIQNANAEPLIEKPRTNEEKDTRQLESVSLGKTLGNEPSTNGDGDSDDRDGNDPLDPIAALLALAGILGSAESSDPLEIGDYAIFAPTQRQKITVKSQGGKAIEKHLGAVCQLIEKNGEKHFRVQFADGQILSVEDSLMKKVQVCPWKFRKGDLVKVSDDKSFVEKESRGHGGWVEKMILIIGEKCVVQEIDTDGDIHVKGINGISCCLNPSVLTSMSCAHGDITEGCFVTISIDFVRLRKTQKQFGVWDEAMIKVIGCMGQVKKENSNDIYDVETGIGIHKYHKSVISFVATDDEVTKTVYLRQQYERKELQKGLGLKSIACVIS